MALFSLPAGLLESGCDGWSLALHWVCEDAGPAQGRRSRQLPRAGSPETLSQLSRAASTRTSLTQEKINGLSPTCVRSDFLLPAAKAYSDPEQGTAAVGCGRARREGGPGRPRGPARAWACTCRAAPFHAVALLWTPCGYNAGIVGPMPSGPGLVLGASGGPTQGPTQDINTKVGQGQGGTPQGPGTPGWELAGRGPPKPSGSKNGGASLGGPWGNSHRSPYPQTSQVHSGSWGPHGRVTWRAGAGALTWAPPGGSRGGVGGLGACSTPHDLPSPSFLLCHVWVTTAQVD